MSKVEKAVKVLLILIAFINKFIVIVKRITCNNFALSDQIEKQLLINFSCSVNVI